MDVKTKLEYRTDLSKSACEKVAFKLFSINKSKFDNEFLVGVHFASFIRVYI